MGCCKSKTEEDADESPAYQMKNIYYDTDGNLRCGNVSNDKDEELRQITLGDAFSTKLKEEEGSEWCIIDTNWFNSWMAFVHFDRNSSSQPGPCRNDRLIQFKESTGQWIPRPFLRATDKRTNGNYSLLSPQLWEVFKERYPGSGPEIRYTYHRHHHEKQKKHIALSEDHKEFVVVANDDEDHELYPPQYWVIEQTKLEDRHSGDGGKSDIGGDVPRVVIGEAKKEGVHDGNRRGVYHPLVDVKHSSLSGYTDPSGDGEESVEMESKDNTRQRLIKKASGEYEHMVDATITNSDRKNILSFFGSQGEDMDFHVSRDEAISEKYTRGLGGVRDKDEREESPVSIAPAVWLFGENNQEI